MAKFILLLIVLLSSSTSLLSQSKILDKPWIKEIPIRYYISGISYDYENSMFALSQSKENFPLDKMNSTKDNRFNEISKAPLKIRDCVFFNPSEKFINNYVPTKTTTLFPEDTESYFYLNTSYFKKYEYYGHLVFPYSTRFYIDSSNVSIVPKQTNMVLDTTINIPTKNYLRPFYFRKYEVTNKEYKEFVNWVRDSIARRILFEGGLEQFGKLVTSVNDSQNKKQLKLNWEKPILWEDPEYIEILEPILMSSSEWFNKKRVVDTRKLHYSYFPIVNNAKDNVLINVYPDTLSWINDFDYSYNEPMTQNYFWHPAYDDYPVVGVNYYQALAFLHWKTQKHQAELNAKGINIKIEYDLPSEAEWDMAATAEIKNKKIDVYTLNYYHLADNSWVTDLSLDKDNMITHIDSTKGYNHYISRRNNFLSQELKGRSHYQYDFKIDGAFHTHKSNINLINKKNGLTKRNELTDMNQDALGICFMGGNVSEWLKESYQENWKPLFELRQQLLASFDDKDIEILSSIEKYYDQNNHQNGMLVRGANWYDERFSNKLGKNTEGINTKVFVNPEQAYSTLGFRYVIHLK